MQDQQCRRPQPLAHRPHVAIATLVLLLLCACGSGGNAANVPASTTLSTQPGAAATSAAASTNTGGSTTATGAPTASDTAAVPGGPATSTTAARAQPGHLRLATTTSTADTGLLPAILPDFERQAGVKVDVVAVGTGQALELGRRGDADVLLVHAPAQEAAFVAAGDGINRKSVMHNDFIIVGPKDDPAKVQGLTKAATAFKQIAAAHASFASRGDKSGTNTKELQIWSTTGLTPTKDLGWYKALGQGMGETLLFAEEQNAYTLTDRGTYLAQQSKLPHLTVLEGGASLPQNADKTLLNPYGVIEVNPAKHPGVNQAVADRFEQWLTSPAVQIMIGDFGKAKFGQSLFYPDAGK